MSRLWRALIDMRATLAAVTTLVVLWVVVFCASLAAVVAIVPLVGLSAWLLRRRNCAPLILGVLYVLAGLLLAGDVLHYVNFTLVLGAAIVLAALHQRLTSWLHISLGACITLGALLLGATLLALAITGQPLDQLVHDYVASASNNIVIVKLAQMHNATLATPAGDISVMLVDYAEWVRSTLAESALYAILHLAVLWGIGIGLTSDVLWCRETPYHQLELPQMYVNIVFLPLLGVSFVSMFLSSAIQSVATALFHALVILPCSVTGMSILGFVLCWVLRGAPPTVDDALPATTAKRVIMGVIIALLTVLCLVFAPVLVVVACLGFIDLFVRLRRLLELILR